MKPLVTFYGDDFTGSSAVLEILALAGLKTVMCLDVPSPALLAKLSDCGAIGIAGIARSQNPQWMDANLPRYFEALKALGAPVLHYKTCSTFDSAPHLGSIGKAIEIGLAVTGADWTPLVVGAPAIGRYQMFGTLFAALDGTAYRLDRHPVMARHPATPMQEADLCRHLDAQTALPKAVVDWRALTSGAAEDALSDTRAGGAHIIAIDAFDDATLAEAGRLIWEAATIARVFATGSQGVEYAIVAHLRKTGLLPATATAPALPSCERVIVVSGSCSEITARQIAHAEQAGFLVLAVDARCAIDERSWQAEITRVSGLAEAALVKGQSALACTARGPQDVAIADFNTALATSGADAAQVHARIGSGLGNIVRGVRQKQLINRAIFSGGDTSGHAMLAVGAEALEFVASLASGVPLLKVRSANPVFDGLEIALKGGQMGDAALFTRAVG